MFNWLTSLFSKKSDWLLIEFFVERVCDGDIYGFDIWRKKDWEEYLETVKNKIKFPNHQSFGEWMQFDFTSFDNYVLHYEVEELTLNEAKVLRKVFEGGYGTFFEFSEYDFLNPTEEIEG